ncbi:MAG: stage III sporulation protein AE [Christensenellales bacterium]|jgi:stage III sporulation protein AE
MKRFVAAALMALIVLCAPKYAAAFNENEQLAALEAEIEKMIGELDTASYDYIIDGLPAETDEVFGKPASEIIADLATGRTAIASESIFDFIIKTFASQAGNASMIVKLVALGILAAMLKALRSSFGGEGPGNVAQYVIMMAAAGILIQTLVFQARVAGAAIESMISAVRALFPAILTLMTAMGGGASAQVFQPAMTLLTGGMAEAASGIILPLTLICGALCAIGALTPRLNLKAMSDMAGSLSKWIMGLCFTVFAGVLAINGGLASTIDGVSIRTAKYAIDNLVPVIGGMFSDTVDTIMGCSLIVKNALGTFSMLLIGISLASPLAGIAVNMLALRLTAAVLGPVGDENLVKTVSGIAGALGLMFAVVITVAAMAFITISLAIAAGNANIMLR